MYKNLMIDIETLDTAPTNKAVVVSVGMVKFNLFDEDTWETIESEPERSAYWVLPIAPQVTLGRTIGSSTLLWWINQIRTGHPDAAEIFSPLAQRWDIESNRFKDVERDMIYKVQKMHAFTYGEDLYGWAKPAHFDLPKIETLFTDFGFEFPIPWYRYKCMSAVKAVGAVLEIPRPKFRTKGNVNHHALWDAKEQVLELQGWFQNMKR